MSTSAETTPLPSFSEAWRRRLGRYRSVASQRGLPFLSDSEIIARATTAGSTPVRYAEELETQFLDFVESHLTAPASDASSEARGGSTPTSSQKGKEPESRRGKTTGKEEESAVRVLRAAPPKGAPGAPKFDGSNATSYLRELEELFEDYGIATDPRKIQKAVRYAEPEIARCIETMTGFISDDWKELKAEILREFRSMDVDQAMFTLSFLEKYKSTDHSREDLRQVIRWYNYISEGVVKNGELAEYARCRYFLETLPQSIRDKLIRKERIDITNMGEIKYQDLFNSAKAIATTQETMDILSEGTKQDANYAELAKQVGSNSHHSRVLRLGKKANKSYEESMSESARTLTSATQAWVQAMEVNKQALSRRPIQNVIPNQATVFQGTPGRTDPALNINNRLAPRGEGTDVCWHCETSGHRKQDCDKLNDLLRNGLVHQNERRRLVLGREGEGGEEIRRIPGKSLHEAVEAKLPSARVQSIRVSDDGSDEEVSEDELGGQMVDVLLARQEDKLAKRSKKGEKSYPSTRFVKEGSYETALGKVPRAVETDIKLESSGKKWQAAGEKTTMKRLVEGKGLDPYKFADRMLQSTLQVTNLEMLQLSKPLQRVFFSKFPLSEAEPQLQERIGEAGAARVANVTAEIRQQLHNTQDRLDTKLYTAASPMAPVTINGHRLDCLLDSGAEVTVMSTKIADKLGLPVSRDLYLKMVGAGGPIQRFCGVIDSVDVQVGRASHEIAVWVAKDLPQGLILGRTYASTALLSLRDERDGGCRASVKPVDGGPRVSWAAVSPEARANRTRRMLGKKKRVVFESSEDSGLESSGND